MNTARLNKLKQLREEGFLSGIEYRREIDFLKKELV